MIQLAAHQETQLNEYHDTTYQLKDLAEELPPGVHDAENIRPAYLPNDLEPNDIHYPDSNKEQHSRAESITGSSLASMGLESSLLNRTVGNSPGTYPVTSNRTNCYPDVKLPKGGGVIQAGSGSMSDTVDESGLKLRNAAQAASSNEIESERIEQYEPGVYITLVALRDGTRDLKRVRFSRRRFLDHQAETWWSENREKVYERYNVRSTDKSSDQAACSANLGEVGV
ncbi:BREVIS RADIX [Spatholobus suberectus]|nr:BREVIS RADIX [Spatholobus suberectus]